jgi:hypothetical protein
MARSRIFVSLVVVAALVGAIVAPAVTALASDAQAERAAVRGQRAAVATQIDTLTADASQIDAALAALDANVEGQQSLLANAQRAYEEAGNRATGAEWKAAARAADVTRLQSELAVVAVDSYVNPPGQELLDRLKAKTATESAQKQAFLGVQASRTGDVVDQLRSAKYELERERDVARAARAEAQRQLEEAQQRIADLAVAQVQQQQFAASLEERLSVKLAEAQALAATDKELSDQMMAEQEALAAKVRSIPVATPVPETPPAEPPPPGGPSTPPPTDPPAGPPPTSPPQTGPPPTTPPVVPEPPRPPTPGTTWVRGIQVASSLGGRLEALMAAAELAGFRLSGWGFRSYDEQVMLRRQNCGSSAYAIYYAPSSQCTPPTAIPGTSMHEQGLAIDFRSNGGAIEERSNPAFVWLSNNAGSYGLCNLPSEPWHWSVNCR